MNRTQKTANNNWTSQKTNDFNDRKTIFSLAKIKWICSFSRKKKNWYFHCVSFIRNNSVFLGIWSWILWWLNKMWNFCIWTFHRIMPNECGAMMASNTKPVDQVTRYERLTIFVKLTIVISVDRRFARFENRLLLLQIATMRLLSSSMRKIKRPFVECTVYNVHFNRSRNIHHKCNTHHNHLHMFTVHSNAMYP